MSEWIKRLAAKYAEVNINESKFLIPEEIPTAERTAFMGAAAAAHKAGQTHFNFGGKKHKVTMKTDTAKAIADDVKEAADLDAKSAEKAVRHDCATHVEHSEFGKGECVPGMHTIVETSEGEGYVTHYDVLFDHGLEENVSVDDLTILAEMSHTHKKMKKEGDEEVVMNPKNKKDSKETMAAEAKVDEISVGKLQRYAKASVKDLEKNRATVRTALEPGAGQKKAERGMKAMKTISKRSRGSDMYTDKMTGRSKVKPTAESFVAEGSYERAAYGKGDAYDRAEAHADAARHHYDQAEKHEKARRFSAADLHTAAAKAHDKAELRMSSIHSKQEKGKNITLSSNLGRSRDAHAASLKANSYNESTVPPVYARILENRAAHYKSATKPQDSEEALRGKGAKDMAADLKGPTDDTEEKGHQDALKAGRVGPSAKARPGDNKSGDKKVIPSATPVKEK
jgi:hypothetical protein